MADQKISQLTADASPTGADYATTIKSPFGPGSNRKVLLSDLATLINTNNVVGPASATDNAIVRFDGTTGKLVQNSVVTISDTGVTAGITDLSATRVAFGSTATFGVVSTATKLWDFSETVTDFTPATSFDGLRLNYVVNPSVDLTGGNAKYIFANSSTISIPNTNTHAVELVGGMTMNVLHSGTGKATTLGAGVFGVTINNSGGAAQVLGVQGSISNDGALSTVDAAYASFFQSGVGHATAITTLDQTVFIATPDHVGTMGTHYGLYIQDQSFGTNKWSIFSEGGDVQISSATGKTSNFILSSADVANPFSAITPTTTWGVITPISGTAGGMRLASFTDADSQPLQIIGAFGVTDPTDTTAAVRISGAKFDGVSNTTNLGAAETVFQVNNNSTNLISVIGDGTSTFAGPLIFSTGVAITNSAYWVGRDTTATNLMKVNAPTGSQVQLSINGTARFQVGTGQAVITQGATTGVQTALNIVGGTITAITASTENSDLILNNNRTSTWNTGALALTRAAQFGQPTHASNGASTFTLDINVDILGAPNSGSNVTILQPVGLRVGSAAATYVANSASIYRDILVPAKTITYTGATNIIAAGVSSSLSLGIVTYTNASVMTLTNAATAYFEGAPLAAGSLTMTNTYTIWSDAGVNRFDGDMLLGGNVNTPDNDGGIAFNIPVTGTDSTSHTWSLAIDSNIFLNIAATGDGAGGIGLGTVTIGGQMLFSVTDNLTTSWRISEGANNYLLLTTTNAAEKIDFGNATTNPAYNFLGSGSSLFKGNVVVGGATAAGATAAGVLALSNLATAPTSSADLVQLYGVDLSAGNATLGIFTETAVAVDVALVSTNSLTVKINGTNYKLMLA